MYVRQHQPIQGGEGSFALSSWTTSTTRPVGISNDRTIFYGGLTNTLKQSVDGGVTWTTVNASFPAGQINGLIETDDGEAILFHSPSGLPGKVYRSTGWTTSHTAATWTLVLTTTGGAVNNYGLNNAVFGDDSVVAGTSKYGVIGCYGTQTPSTGDATTSGRYVYFTSDYGANWSLVFDLYTWSGNTAGMHVHSAAYDPWWDRLWVAWGDVQMNGKLDVVYSDDHGATWTQLDALPSTYSALGAMQSTTVLPRPDCILFGSDPNQGLWMIPRRGYRVFGKLTIIYMNSGGTANTSISTHLTTLRGGLGSPIFHAWTSERTDMLAGFSVSHDGTTFQRVFDYPQPSLKAVNVVYGPLLNGTILAGGQLSTTYYLLIGSVIEPEEGTLTLRLDGIGDGTTTVFTVPHYQGRIPVSYDVFPQSAAALAAATVSIDATNITVTFTVAPAAAAVVQMAIRIRA